ncbi:alcohol dehydrogenase [Marinobacterium halophilum]|uniref:Alcohol dehydrogenase n=1 Tax=Marinobacterium halophilum TaxID=267374 RepID=A0A2P8F255_9GAMM|nr:iron-containing alcohol dehydrogenase PsrA [Marinobacterium halophilum]PSL15808.1 alcohol dehydrogenase [Marinobacterium halophilum]
MWAFHNPVNIHFGAGVLETLADSLQGRPYALVTYSDSVFQSLSERVVALVGEPALVIDNIQPNPDFTELEASCARWMTADQAPEVIIALGGGSVIDTAKVLAGANGDFNRVRRFLQQGDGREELVAVPIIAIPTTAGTGSEVTCWATVWHSEAQRKYSLSLPELYPEVALVDPELTLELPLSLTVSTALDALSHALESLWNVNRNPISSAAAVSAAREIIEWLPVLVEEPENLMLRTRIAGAALMAGVAFSNTKTAIAHNLSYPITLRHGTAHGEACSFTLPTILRAVSGENTELDSLLAQIFGTPVDPGIERLEQMLQQLGVSTDYQDYGISDEEWDEIVDAAFAGERGANFIGDKDRFLAVSDNLHPRASAQNLQ